MGERVGGTPRRCHFVVDSGANSLLYAGLATAGCLLTQSMAGFAFARLRFPGRNVLFVR